MMKTNRRTFIKKTGASLAGVGALTILPSRVWGAAVAPSDQVTVALIGCRSMGFGLLRHFLSNDDVRCTALCDVDENLMREKADTVQKDFDQKPALFTDFREVLEQKDIDAVIIGTPDHWHCLMMVYALQAGKDVYVEKPLGNSIEECNIMVQAANRYDKQVVQVGQQQRSGFIFLKAMDFLKNGKIGNLRKINIWANFSYGLGPVAVPNSPVPSGVHYDTWLGPAPERPFNENRFHGSWRHFWDYGSGMASDWGVHLIDIALWANNDLEGPDKSLVYADNTFKPEKKRARETFDSMNITFPKKDFVINFDVTAGPQRGPWDMLYGIAFVGDDATMVASRDKLVVYPEWDNDKEEFKTDDYKFTEGEESHSEHVRDFLNCIKSRNTPVCTPEMGRASAVHMHIANIAGRVGEPVLLWDDANNRFTNSEAANELIKPVYRKPWKLPQV